TSLRLASSWQDQDRTFQGFWREVARNGKLTSPGDIMSRLAILSPDLGLSLELGTSHAQNSSHSLIDL
ncbi:hypothetical protein A2U01_0102195, partial [Trifolium medium]|nr:hypothetical protein [Trifolium medium]